MNSPPSSGPSTVVTPKTAPSAPWYLPRSRNGITSPISAVAVTIRPPAPMPCTARNAIIIDMFCDRPQKNEPTMKISTLSWKIRFRP